MMSSVCEQLMSGLEKKIYIPFSTSRKCLLTCQMTLTFYHHQIHFRWLSLYQMNILFGGEKMHFIE